MKRGVSSAVKIVALESFDQTFCSSIPLHPVAGAIARPNLYPAAAGNDHGSPGNISREAGC
jgi:hypothetical protein